MKLIVGLGNPGKEYSCTRHNIGFRVIYELAKKYSMGLSGNKHRALYGQGMIQGEKVILAQPLTYMNLSGEAVLPLMRYFKVELEDIIIIYDDLDLDPGFLRMRGAGGHGGHNGIRSIINCLGTKDFARLRIGIGRPEGQIPVRDFVLSRFSKDEESQMVTATSRAIDGLELWLKEGLDKAMNQINRNK